MEEFLCLVVSVGAYPYPICYEEDRLVSFHLVKDHLIIDFPELFFDFNEEIKKSYESNEIYNLMDKTILIWNYKGYYYLSQENNQSIKLLNQDEYNNSLAYRYDSYLLTANYDMNHYFTEIFVVNAKKAELSSFKFEDEISFNSYFMGHFKRDIYLVDRKSRLQYKINMKKKAVEVVGNESKGGRWYNNGWEDVSINRLVQNNHYFVRDKIYHFELIDEELYYVIGNHKKLISNHKVKHIVQITEDTVYYLVGSVLYMYSPTIGEIPLVENPEWNFHYENKIFIFSF
jgi:hypothetical protein